MEAQALLAHGLALEGREQEARELFGALLASAQSKYFSPYNRALIHAALGEEKLAIASLEQAYNDRAEWMIYLGVDFRLRRLRNNPAFRNLLNQVGCHPGPL